MIRVYVASRLANAPMIRTLASPHLFLCARWLQHVATGTPDDADHARRFWPEDVADAAGADLLVVYAAPEDHLRGALVEAGVAIHAGVPVVVVGDHPDYGTWRYHPGVMRVAHLEELTTLVELIDARGIDQMWDRERRVWR